MLGVDFVFFDDSKSSNSNIQQNNQIHQNFNPVPHIEKIDNFKPISIYDQFGQSNQSNNNYPIYDSYCDTGKKHIYDNSYINKNESAPEYVPYDDINKPSEEVRKFDPEFRTGESYNQQMQYIIREKKELAYNENIEFSSISQQVKYSYNLKVSSVEVRCPNSTLTFTLKTLKSNTSLMFDYSYTDNRMRVCSPKFEENRVLLKDGTSVVRGYKVYDFDSKKIILKNKENIQGIENDFTNIEEVSISGDNCVVFFEDNLFNGKNIKIKATGLSKVYLGKSTVKGITIECQMGFVDSSNIIKQ